VLLLVGWALCGHEMPAGCGAGDEEEGEEGEEQQEAQQGSTEGKGKQAKQVKPAADAKQEKQQERGQHGNGSVAGVAVEATAATASAASAPSGTAGGPAAAQQAQGAQQAQQQDLEQAFDPMAVLSRERCQQVGMKAKLLIDMARCQWLQQLPGPPLSRVQLLNYIEPEVSGENRLLLAM
jgi:tRNA:m4X modification enzyme